MNYMNPQGQLPPLSEKFWVCSCLGVTCSDI